MHAFEFEPVTEQLLMVAIDTIVQASDNKTIT